jgi:N-sulfoglucosamine sulfohydrolase
MKNVMRLGLVLMAAGCANAVAADRPNVLLIVSEDNGPELGCYGDPYAKTPRLDRLADQGVRFDRAFVPQAGCSQSRASFLTGLYPHQHGQIGLATWGFRLYRDDTENLPGRLKAAGYRTGIIGKLHINPEAAFPFDFKEMQTANFARKNLGDYASSAEKFIAQDERPFFLSVNYPDAHDPWLRQVDGLPATPQTGADVKAMAYFGIDPPAMREMVADYYNCISRLDTLVGDLLDALERSGKADNTLVIYIGDHGADMLRSKRTCYEGGLRIPMIVRWPGIASPQVREELVSTIDIMPTVLAAAGVARPNDLPGRDLRTLLSGDANGWRTHLFAEFHTHAAAANFYPQRCVRDDRYKLIENLLPGEVNPGFENTFSKLQSDAASNEHKLKLDLASAVAEAPVPVQAAYALMKKLPQYELYDLQSDPYEFHNLADSRADAEVFAELKQQLATWRRETNDPLLDRDNLQRLKAEVTSLKNKKAGKKNEWKYPQYFFAK